MAYKKTYPQHKGWVYVLSNPTFPNLVKVGYTDKPVERRMKELNDTAIPTPYTKKYEALVNGANEVEKKSHSLLSDYKYNKEYFKCPPQVAVDAIRQATKLLGKELHHDEVFFSEEYSKAPIKSSKQVTLEAFGLHQIVQEKVCPNADCNYRGRSLKSGCALAGFIFFILLGTVGFSEGYKAKNGLEVVFAILVILLGCWFCKKWGRALACPKCKTRYKK